VIPVARFGHQRTRLGRWWSEHPPLLRALALIALAWYAAYLVWRVGWSLEGTSPLLGWSLLAAECFGWWSMLTMAVFTWRIPAPMRPLPSPGRAVDVYVCTYDEPVEVVEATLTGCRALRYPHTTWLLDDGRRPEMVELAARLDARYLARADNTHAKAGNLNHALELTDGELVFVLDADHVPLPDALDALVGYFDDPSLAVVQSPHDFYNQDSVQHYDAGRHEQSVFYEVIQPGKARHGAAYWCGSGALMSRAALRSIGGVATDTIAEDFHTSMRLITHGWRTHYHQEDLVEGLAPHDLSSYLLQRDRWARGNLAVFRTPESPLRPNGLSLMQRWSFLASLLAYLAGPVRMLSLVVLAITLWTGRLPMAASTAAILLLWLPTTLLDLTAASALSRGHMKVKEAFCFELSTMWIHLRALRCAVWPGATTFRVTPKEGIDTGGWETLRQLRAAVALDVVLVVGLLVRMAGWFGWVALPTLPGIARVVVPVVAAVEAARMTRALAHLARHRQLRREFRFSCDERATLAPVQGGLDASTAPVRLVDLSRTGLGVIAEEAVEIGSEWRVIMDLPRADGRHELVDVCGTVASCRAGALSGWHIGLQVPHRSAAAEDAIVEFTSVVCMTRRLRGADPQELGVGPSPFTTWSDGPRELVPSELEQAELAPSELAQSGLAQSGLAQSGLAQSMG
jgi:cellulose synthase (UDP-forming)